jgi:hypothetical protein
VAAASDPVVCDGQVEDQAAVPCRVLEIALDFHVAAPLACAGRHLVLGPCVHLSSPTSPVASGSGWGSQPPPPPMGGVGGSGMVRARIAALEAATGAVGGAATGAVASRTYPLFAPTTTVDVGTQTDHMVFPFVFPGGGKWTL